MFFIIAYIFKFHGGKQLKTEFFPSFTKKKHFFTPMTKRALDNSGSSEFLSQVLNSKSISRHNVGPLALTVQTYPVGNVEFHRNGTVLIGCPLENIVIAMDPSTFNEVARVDSEHDPNNPKKSVVSVSGMGLDRLQINHGATKSVNVSHGFKNIEMFNKNMTVVGVRSDDPAGYVSKSQGTFQKLTQIHPYAVAVMDRQQIFSGYFEPQEDIYPGTKLWAIVKHVPINEGAVAYGNTTKTAMQIMFYASPIGTGKPRKDAMPLSDDNTKRFSPTSLYSPEYKEVSAILDDEGKPIKPVAYDVMLKEGVCIFLGCAVNFHAVSGPKTPYHTRTALKDISQRKVVTTAPLDVFVSINHMYK